MPIRHYGGLTFATTLAVGRLNTPSSGAATPSSVLASNLAIEYDPARGQTLNGAEIDSLACQVSGHVISAAAAANRPAYTASDASFGGFPSFTSSSTGSDGLFSAAAHGSDLIASGASPYQAWLGMFIGAATPATRTVWRLYSAASLSAPYTAQRVGTTGVLQHLTNNVITDLNTPTADAVHLFELIYDGSGNLEFWQDNVLIEENATAAAASAVRRVCMGARGDNTGHIDAKHGYLIATHSAPTAQQRTDLLPFWRARGAPV